MFIEIIKQFCQKRIIDEDMYISILLSLLNDNIIIYGDANRDLLDILLKEIISLFRKRFVVNKQDFINI